MLIDCIDRAQLAELASSRSRQTGLLRLESMPRLARLVGPGSDADIEVVAAFASSESGLARLDLAVRAELTLLCQRCLGPLVWPVALAASLTVVGDDSEADGLEDPFESVVMDAGGLRLGEVAEDEVLAALPLASRHEAGVACSAPASSTDAEQESAGGVSRPFANLGALLKAGPRDAT